MSETDEAYQRLRSWSKSLSNQVASCWPQIQEALDENSPLPSGCPSHASLALLILAQVEKDLSEVNGAMADVRGALRSLSI